MSLLTTLPTLTLLAALGACVGGDPAPGTPTPTADAAPDAPTDAGTDAPPAASATVYVDPFKGDDNANGRAEATPVKTLTKAASLAKKEETIKLAAGVYGADETWPITLPDDVVLAGGQRGAATIDVPSPKRGFTLGDGARIRNVRVKAPGFGFGIGVGTKLVQFQGVDFEGAGGVAVADLGPSGTARVEILDCTFTQILTGLQVLGARDIEVKESTFSGVTGTAVELGTNAKGTLQNDKFLDGSGVAIALSSTGLVTVVETTIERNSLPPAVAGVITATGAPSSGLSLVLARTTISSSGGGVSADKGARVQVDDSKISGNRDFGFTVSDGASVTMRRTVLTDHAVANFLSLTPPGGKDPIVDLGTVTAPGRNDLTARANGLSVNVSAQNNEIFYFVGNMWTPGSPEPTTSVSHNSPVPFVNAPHFRVVGDAKLVFGP